MTCKDTKRNQSSSSQAEIFELTRIGTRKVTATFDDSALSSCGGLVMLREVERNCGIVREIAAVINDSRKQWLVQHPKEEMLLQRVAQIACGYEDADDCDTLRDDKMVKLFSGRDPEAAALASQPTMSRLENSLTKKELWDIGEVFVNHFISSYEKAPKTIILDCDDTNANTYGSQQLTLFNNYYGEYCYMPLYIFEGQSGKLILPMLRPGRGNKSINIAGLLIRLVSRLRQCWKNTEIIVRGDSHFCSHEFMDWAVQQRGVRFITGLTGNSVLNRMVERWVAYDMEVFRSTGRPSKRYHEFMYRAGSWQKAQRVIVKIEVGMLGPNVRFIVTNFDGPRKLVYETGYCGRGSMELMIKELKTYLHADRMSCSSFAANQFRLYLHAAAYVLLHSMQHTLLKETDFEGCSMLTLVTKLMLSAVRVEVKKCSVRLHFQEGHLFRRQLEWVLRMAG